MSDKITKSPQIRFAGFTDAWEQRKLGDYIIPYNEVTTQNNQYPVFTSSRKGLFFQKDYYDGNQIASEDNTGYNIVPRGYFTYRHMSDDLVFKFNINNLADNGIVSTLYPVFTTTESLDSRYLQYQLNEGEEFKRFAILQKQGGSRTYMYLSKLKNMTLTMPRLDEQIKIGNFFKQLDDTITLHQRKLELLKDTKKSLLQKMFPNDGANVPEIRFVGFTDTWEQRRLNEYLTTSKVKNKDERFGKEDVLSVSGVFGIVNQIEFQGRSFAGVSVASYGVVETGDVVYTKSPLKSNPFGIIKTNKGQAGIVSTLYAVYKPNDNVDSKFVERYFENDQRLNGYLKPLVNKGAKNDMKVSDDNALIGTVVFPGEVDEQRKISSFFNQLDNLITLHQREINSLENLKKLLLQQMFV
ncbi:restriction endonuclease subunit S [Bacillus sp. CLL-7-23]|uniref:Restriction endonuclease subunit S n=1 Tax=Bacillus changyiensis TaxID=3004103 RepID=A0ABT4X6Z3_9BACI|nr:restriction endonuclease subunit S [Bacillus changyiensis]MDA7027509.1 restriction endonuclease subunit S [Bacillus changyiensis]